MLPLDLMGNFRPGQAFPQIEGTVSVMSGKQRLVQDSIREGNRLVPTV